jgi:hypothetical protein
MSLTNQSPTENSLNTSKFFQESTDFFLNQNDAIKIFKESTDFFLNQNDAIKI